MLIVFKNQVKIIWKKWFSFIGIFILILLSIVLTNSALSASANIKNVNDSLKKSDMYQYSIDVDNNYFNKEGFNKIQAYFFDDAPLNSYQKNLISENRTLSVLNHQDEIEKWNYNFQAWIINQVLTANFPSNKLAVDYNINTSAIINNNNFNITIANGFNDSDWNFINSRGVKENRYNLKTSNLVFLTQGRLPENNDEVVINISVANQNNSNFQIGNTISISNQDYKIVGRGYNFSSYLDYDDESIKVWMTNSAMNEFWNKRSRSYTDNKAQYYINLNQDQINLFKILVQANYSYFPSYSTINNNFDDLEDNVKLKLTDLETLLFTIFGLIVFAVSIIIVIIFLKKDLTRQSGSLGILIGLGTKPRTLAFNLAFSYLTLLIIPLILGFCISFVLQFYLTQLISAIIFFPFPLVGFFVMPTIITLIIFPVILIVSLSLIIYLLVNKSPLDLLYKRQKNKHQKLKKVKSSPLFKRFINYRLTLAFAKSNKTRVFSTLTIFIVNFFLVLFLLSFINVYNYSSSFFEKQYTSYGNRIFNQNNPTINDLFKNMFDKKNYDDNTNESFHWVSNQDFTKGQGKKYNEITSSNFNTITDWYNTYFSPATVKYIAENPKLVENFVSKEFYQLLLQMIVTWKHNNIYPYITNGFKIYQSDNSLVSSKLSAKWNKSSGSGPNYFNFEGYKNNQFSKWIYLQGENTNQALDLINQENSSYLNAILPLEMAKQLNLQIGSTITGQISVGYSNDQRWAAIPIHVVGINNYNYFDKNLIVNQQLLFKFIINQYKKINPTVEINISSYDTFLNTMLVKDKVPEIARNISFYNYDKDYHKFKNFQLNGDFQCYTATKYSDYGTINIKQYIGNLIKSLEILIIIVLIISATVILILISLVFSENKNNIISLKFLGYNNFKIANFLLVPYIMGFVFFTLSITGVVYLILRPIIKLLLSVRKVVLLFNFSWILWLILIISIAFLILIAFSIGFIQIMKSKISDLELLE